MTYNLTFTINNAFGEQLERMRGELSTSLINPHHISITNPFHADEKEISRLQEIINSEIKESKFNENIQLRYRTTSNTVYLRLYWNDMEEMIKRIQVRYPSIIWRQNLNLSLLYRNGRAIPLEWMTHLPKIPNELSPDSLDLNIMKYENNRMDVDGQEEYTDVLQGDVLYKIKIR